LDIYLQTENGAYTFNGMSIPNNTGNRHYRQMQEGVTAGTASITAYALSLADARTERKRYINDERDKAINGGASYGGNTYDTDKESRSNLTSTHSGVNDGWPLPEGFAWRTSDNIDIPFTSTEVNGLAHAMLDHVNFQYGKSWIKKAAIDAAEDVAAVSAIVW
jgi:hypothetical protein